MADRRVVIVPIHSLVQRALPPVCAVSGTPSERLDEFRFSDSSVTRALFAAFVRAEHRRNFVTGSVPLSEHLADRRRRLRQVATGAAAAALLFGVLGVALQTGWPITTMVVLLGLASLAMVLRSTVSPQGVVQGQYVWLTRVDPAFADAVLDLVEGGREPGPDEEIIRAGIGPVPMRAMLGIAIWAFVILWIAIR